MAAPRVFGRAAAIQSKSEAMRKKEPRLTKVPRSLQLPCVPKPRLAALFTP
jgi:hypothetical protein